MTWAEAAQALGRRPVTIIEMDLDYCQLTYGVGDCPAVLGVDSEAKCYQTRKTCPVPAAYDPAARTYRFSDFELGYETLSVPCVQGVTFTSTKIDPGKGLGIRASATVTLQDFTWDDRDLDKYVSERTYDPEAQGTYFGRLLRRNPYYQNRTMRVKRGYLDDDGTVDLTKFRTHTYLIDRIEGPDSKGSVKVSCIDVIRMADDDKAQVPRTSGGTLDDPIDEIDTLVTLLPAGIGDEEYPLFGVAAIDDELVNFSRIGDVVTLNLRGAQTTLAQEHEAGATFQLCAVYDDAFVSDIIYEWLTDPRYGNVPASYIDKAAWDEECLTWISGYRLNFTIAIPTGVNQLINELLATCLFYIWYDDVNATIRLQCIRPEDPADAVRELTDDAHFLADSLSITEDPDQRVSEVWVPFARKNPLLKLDEYANYQTIPIFRDSNASDVVEYAERRVRRIPCRFFSSENSSQANVLGARIIARYRDNPRIFKFELDAKDGDLSVGDVVHVLTVALQDVTGAPVRTAMVILKRTEKKAGDRFAYEATDTFFSGRYGFILPTGTADYLLATEAQRNKGAFICVTATLKMPNGDDPYKVI